MIFDFFKKEIKSKGNNMELRKIISKNGYDYHHEDCKRNWQGECVEYWNTGIVWYKGFYKDNERHGIFTYYTEDGDIDYKEYYWNGEEISEKEYYYMIGKEDNNMKPRKVIDENNDGSYHHIDELGKWQGERVRFWSNGNIWYKTYYKDHKEHGICTWYNENGEIDYKEYFWDGMEISEKEYYNIQEKRIII